jgi:HK97 family phage prohead protease
MTFHPSCGQRQRAAEDAQRASVIGIIRGRAVPFNAWGSFNTADGEAFEYIESGAFADSMTAGRVVLQVSHNRAAIEGSMLLEPKPDGLDFTFLMRNTPYGRQIYRRVSAGECEGCSVGYQNPVRRRDHWARGDHIVSADLVEISLCIGTRPAWHGTFAVAA